MYIEFDASDLHKKAKSFKRATSKRMKRKFIDTIVLSTVKREVLTNFQRQGRPGPGRPRWEELSDSRKKQRRLMGIPASGPKLIATGKMMREIVSGIRVSFIGDTVKIRPSNSNTKSAKMSALHYGSPPVKINAFGQGNNKGMTAIKNTKYGLVAWRLPSRPFFFITKQAMGGILKEGKYFFHVKPFR